jgi:hypothetical protein
LAAEGAAAFALRVGLAALASLSALEDRAGFAAVGFGVIGAMEPSSGWMTFRQHYRCNVTPASAIPRRASRLKKARREGAPSGSS